MVKYTINDNPKGLKKIMPFLISNSEKANLSILLEIDKLIVEKERIFKASYQKDISIVEEFISYAKNKLLTGEIFYYEKDYENYLWTRKEFPQNMFKYLSYQAQTNPRILTKKYIDDMKGYFALIGLGINDENKAKKANQYFSQSKDPFSFNIPEKYNDVKSDIYMSIAVMTENENLLERIANDVFKKYL